MATLEGTKALSTGLQALKRSREGNTTLQDAEKANDLEVGEDANRQERGEKGAWLSAREKRVRRNDSERERKEEEAVQGLLQVGDLEEGAMTKSSGNPLAYLSNVRIVHKYTSVGQKQ